MRCRNCGGEEAEEVILHTTPDEQERAALCQDCQFLMLDSGQATKICPPSRTGGGSDE